MSLTLGVTASALALSGCGGGGGGSGGSSAGTLVKLTTASVPAGSTGASYVAPITAVFPHPPGKFLVASGELPPGLELDQNTGEITGFPRQTGAFHFEIAARDGIDLSLPPGRDASFSQDVQPFVLNVALGTPNILPQTIPSAQYRASYAYKIDVAGGTPPYTFAQTGGTLPAGLSVSPTGVISNFPTQASPAVGVPFDFEVTVTDANGQTDTQAFQLDVLVLPLLMLTSQIPAGAKDFPYDVLMQLASAGGGQPISWSQVLPVGPGEIDLNNLGMEISIDGHLRNRLPATGPTTLGTHLFTLQVTDEAGQVATRQFSLTVKPGPVLASISPKRSTQPGPYTVSGSNFQQGAILYFKPGPTQVAVTPTFVNDTTLTFSVTPTTPVGGGGGVPVMVMNPDGGWFTLQGAFVFTAANVSFGTKGFISSNFSSTGLDCADVNGDGLADIVHCGTSGLTPFPGGPVASSPGVAYLRNTGGSPLTFVSTTLDGGNFYDVKFADVNVDGRLDIVALGQTSIKVWLNGVSGNPVGVFSAGPTSSIPGGYSFPSELTIGKFNSDQIPDVAFGIPFYPNYVYSGAVFTMAGNGSGAFSSLDSAVSQLPNSYGVVSLAAVDSDGDGRDELAAGIGMNPYTGYVFWYSGTSTNGLFSGFGSRGNPVNVYYAQTTGVASGDFFGTGQQGLVTLTSASPSYQANTKAVYLFSGSGLGSATALPAPSSILKCVAKIDADFDGKMDWAVSTQSSGLAVYRGSTQAIAATLDAAVGVPSISSPRTGRIASGDLDGDGRPDLLSTTSYWIIETMGAWQSGSYYSLGTSGNGGQLGIVYYLNSSN